MSINRKFAQLQPFTLAGSGSVIGDATLVISSFVDIDGTQLTMDAFGTKGYATLEPGSSVQEEQFSFSGITANANGTSTLTGVSHIDFLYPYTATVGLSKSHAGGVRMVITNTSGFYNDFANKDDDETITETWTFTDPNVPRMDVDHTYIAGEETYFATKGYVDGVVVAGAPNASTTAKGIVQEATQAQVDARTATGSTGARLFIDPIALRATKYHDYASDAGATDTYAITVTPAVTALANGDIYIFRANTVNTGVATLNVNTLGDKPIRKYKDKGLDDSDIKAGQIVTVIYDSVNDVFQLQNPPAKQQISQNGTEIYAASSAGSDAYSITLAPAVTALVTGQVFRFKADVANTDAASLNVNGLGVTPIKKQVSVDLATGDILVGQVVEVVFDGTNFQLLSTIASTFSFAAGVTTPLSTTAAGNNDVTISTGFMPRVIKLHYSIQGHSRSTEGTSAYLSQKGVALYNGATLVMANTFWGDAPMAGNTANGSALSGENLALAITGTPNTFFTQNIITTAPNVGRTTGGSAIAITLSIASISATAFVLRRLTEVDTVSSTARAQIAWEAWG